MAYDDALAQRVRDRMMDEPGVSEKKMFGGLAFLTSGNMTVGIHGDDLIARIDPETMDAHGHVARGQEGHPTEHLLLAHPGLVHHPVPDPLGQRIIVGHGWMLSRLRIS